jgi:hypothetical protein
MNNARANLAGGLNAVEIGLPRFSKDELWRVAVANCNTQSEWHAAKPGYTDSVKVWGES